MVYYTYFPDYRLVCKFKNFVSKRFAKKHIRRYQLEAEVYGSSVPTAKELKAKYNTIIDRKYSEDAMLDESVKQIRNHLQ